MNITDVLDISPPKKPDPIMKEDFMMKVFAYVESITVTKQNLMINEEEERFYKKASFMINKALSFSPDLIHVANMVNKMHEMPARQQYEMLLAIVPRKIRRNKWPKKSPKSMYMDTIREYYGYNEAKAEEAMHILSIEQMIQIENKNNKKDLIYDGDGG
jgi:hypothetical protein